MWYDSYAARCFSNHEMCPMLLVALCLLESSMSFYWLQTECAQQEIASVACSSFFFIIINGYNGIKNFNCISYVECASIYTTSIWQTNRPFLLSPSFSPVPSSALPFFPLPLFLLLTGTHFLYSPCVLPLSHPALFYLHHSSDAKLSRALQSSQESVSNFKFVITIRAMIKWCAGHTFKDQFYHKYLSVDQI